MLVTVTVEKHTKTLPSPILLALLPQISEYHQCRKAQLILLDHPKASKFLLAGKVSQKFCKLLCLDFLNQLFLKRYFPKIHNKMTKFKSPSRKHYTEFSRCINIIKAYLPFAYHNSILINQNFSVRFHPKKKIPM